MIVIVGVIAHQPAGFTPLGGTTRCVRSFTLLKAVPGGWLRPLSTWQRGGYRFCWRSRSVFLSRSLLLPLLPDKTPPEEKRVIAVVRTVLSVLSCRSFLLFFSLSQPPFFISSPRRSRPLLRIPLPLFHSVASPFISLEFTLFCISLARCSPLSLFSLLH